ncbi:peptidase P60 [Algimonas arctica]|uniref:Peptidase P60 n=1 Tax=Algimonas arctica TaxID=1479486 RepID=A0A8J3CR33_9PROT|nr:NlpC/P60 family protein [Algimonas arctica]GHA96962.1 peptidase P60 [Algimonas arctica]
MASDSRFDLPDGIGPKIARRRVVTEYAPLLTHPNLRAAQQTELVHGQAFDVHAEQERWVFGRACPLISTSRRDGYIGWVDATALGDLGSAHTHFVSSISAPVFARADLKSHIVMSLPLGSRISVMLEKDNYCQIGAGAYISRMHVREIAAPEHDLVAVARRYLGQPYVWGGNGARGVDCSGIVQMSLSACGIDAPRDADLQEKTLGRVVAQPDHVGDLLFWPGHVGILATKTRLLHANATHMAVVEEPLGPALKRMTRAGVNLRAIKRL